MHRAVMASVGDGGGAARRDLVCVTGGSGFISARWIEAALRTSEGARQRR